MLLKSQRVASIRKKHISITLASVESKGIKKMFIHDMLSLILLNITKSQIILRNLAISTSKMLKLTKTL